MIKGSKHSEEAKRKISLARSGKLINEQHFAWKGKNAGYRAIHIWLDRRLGKPQFCEYCKKTTIPKNYNKKTFFQWANISGKYKREFNDWKRLCRKCHGKFDKENRFNNKIN